MGEGRFPGTGIHCSHILLDTICSIVDFCPNRTRAVFKDEQGLVVEMYFKALMPPNVSHFFVRAYDLTGSCLAREPEILGTAQGFALLSIPFSGNDTHMPYTDFFVYKAGPGLPSIRHVPRPYPTDSNLNKASILPPYPTDAKLNMAAVLPIHDSREHFAVVFPTLEYFMLESRNHYTLHIYRSDSNIWCKKVATLSANMETQSARIKLLYFNTASVVYAGAGLIGWVDLWWGILLCNVLDEKPVIRFVPLPVPEPWNTPHQFCSEFEDINQRPYRHMAVNNGVIKFIELKFHTHGDTSGKGWMATRWSRPIASDSWNSDLTVDSSNISVTPARFLHVLPEILDDEKKLTWQKIMTGGPTLSLNDDIFYLMAKVDLCHPTACILAVNTGKLTLESGVEFSSKRMLGFEPTYVQSDIWMAHFKPGTTHV